MCGRSTIIQLGAVQFRAMQLRAALCSIGLFMAVSGRRYRVYHTKIYASPPRTLTYRPAWDYDKFLKPGHAGRAPSSTSYLDPQCIFYFLLRPTLGREGRTSGEAELLGWLYDGTMLYFLPNKTVYAPEKVSRHLSGYRLKYFLIPGPSLVGRYYPSVGDGCPSPAQLTIR